VSEFFKIFCLYLCFRWRRMFLIHTSFWVWSFSRVETPWWSGF